MFLLIFQWPAMYQITVKRLQDSLMLQKTSREHNCGAGLINTTPTFSIIMNNVQNKEHIILFRLLSHNLKVLPNLTSWGVKLSSSIPENQDTKKAKHNLTKIYLSNTPFDLIDFPAFFDT